MQIQLRTVKVGQVFRRDKKIKSSRLLWTVVQSGISSVRTMGGKYEKDPDGVALSFTILKMSEMVEVVGNLG